MTVTADSYQLYVILGLCVLAAVAAAVVMVGSWVIPQLYGDARAWWQRRQAQPTPVLAPPTAPIISVASPPVPAVTLLRRSHRRDETATTPLRYRPRHLGLGERDARHEALLATTQAFEILAAQHGYPVLEHGPREAELVCTRELWDPGSGEWRQLDLLEAVS